MRRVCVGVGVGGCVLIMKEDNCLSSILAYLCIPSMPGLTGGMAGDPEHLQGRANPLHDPGSVIAQSALSHRLATVTSHSRIP